MNWSHLLSFGSHRIVAVQSISNHPCNVIIRATHPGMEKGDKSCRAQAPTPLPCGNTTRRFHYFIDLTQWKNIRPAIRHATVMRKNRATEHRKPCLPFRPVHRIPSLRQFRVLMRYKFKMGVQELFLRYGTSAGYQNSTEILF